MRSQVKEGGPVCDINGGALYDSKLPPNDERDCEKGLGPFTDVHEFHSYLIKNGKESVDYTLMVDPDKVKLKEAFDLQFLSTDWYENKVCFTHGDIRSIHILVNQKDNIVTSLDWDTAGWWPLYYESFGATIFTREKILKSSETEKNMYRERKEWYEYYAYF